MSIDSFGFQVMSLDEIIEALTDIRSRYPQMAQQSVWIENCPPLRWPVKNVTLEMDRGVPRTRLYVERGGN